MTVDNWNVERALRLTEIPQLAMLRNTVTDGLRVFGVCLTCGEREMIADPKVHHRIWSVPISALFQRSLLVCRDCRRPYYRLRLELPPNPRHRGGAIAVWTQGD